MKKYDKYTFFWDGPFSQWDSSPFTIDGRTYNCCEQYMMYKKAILFADFDTAVKIMATSSPREQKKLGRQVKSFLPGVWSEVARDIVFRANMAKFTSSVYHYDALMATTNTLIVEASPYDTIWGIGMGVAEANNTPESQWKGLNWLGQVLTEVREALLYVGDYVPAFEPEYAGDQT